MTPDSESLVQLQVALGSPVIDAGPIPWGDTRSTLRLTLADGRVLAARWLDGRAARAEGARLVRIGRSFSDGGVTVPWPMAVHAIGDGAWVVAPWLPGTTGAAQLDDPSASRAIAIAMSSLHDRVAGLEPTRLELDGTWSEPDRLAVAASAWAVALGTVRAAEIVEHAVELVLRHWGRAGGEVAWRPVVSHGDFVPINVIVSSSGGLALVDLGGAHVAPWFADLAWWSWIVRFHHPAAWEIGWPAMLAAAGIERDGSVDDACAGLGRLRAIHRAATTADLDERGRWMQRLATAADRWTGQSR